MHLQTPYEQFDQASFDHGKVFVKPFFLKTTFISSVFDILANF